MFKRLKNIGPGAMVAAAFIGPGTVTTATIAGAQFGYTLLWAVLFSVIATYVLQEMSARLGLIGRMGLGDAIRVKQPTGIMRLLSVVLVLGAILVGNAAYEAGNITGAVLGFGPLLDTTEMHVNPLIIIIGFMAFALLYSGKYHLIERALVTLVGIMGLVFFLASWFSKPELKAVLTGLFIPSLPKGSLIMVIGLIGTTVVPYNLFLHASSVHKKWQGVEHLKSARSDTLLSIVVGGLITLAIIITAATVLQPSGGEMKVNDLSGQLEPFLGESAKYFIALGFLAAGLSSSITAPLAASFAVAGILGWSSQLVSTKFRMVWIFVLCTGLILASFGFKPLQLILFAQVANGILLPVIAVFLLWIMNDQEIMGKFKNGMIENFGGLCVVLITLVLGLKSIFTAIF
ncbi:MAG: Nramp family divalent metal transporter [Saprospiraceae bacterium]|nr:Nramp family divalent metal transporter [Saprospiraceae bacterium]